MNIVLTLNCNNHCPYCFQKGIHKNEEMSLENIERILNWSVPGPERRIGLLGGEPTLYSYFSEALKLIHEIRPLNPITVMSNLLGPFDNIKLLTEYPNIIILANTTYDEGKEEEFIHNFNYLYTNGVNLCPGITLTPNREYNQKIILRVVALAIKYPVHHIRVGLQTPIPSEGGITNIYNYDEDIQAILDLLPKNTCIQFDCPVNYCQISKGYYDILSNSARVIFLENTCKGPCLDIMPDLSTTYCFSSPSNYKINNIFDFPNELVLTRYLFGKELMQGVQSQKCLNCKEFKEQNCIPCHSFNDVLVKGEQN